MITTIIIIISRGIKHRLEKQELMLLCVNCWIPRNKFTAPFGINLRPRRVRDSQLPSM